MRNIISCSSSSSSRSLALITTVLIIVVVVPECLSMPQGSPLSGPSSGSTSKRRLNNSYQSSTFKFTNPAADSQTLNKWITTSLKFFDFHRCTLANIGGEDECFKLSQVRRSQIAVYLAWPNKATTNTNPNLLNDNNTNNNNNNNNNSSNFGFNSGKSENLGKSGSGSSTGGSVNSNKVYAILPDSNTPKASGPHDLVLALDPYPTANFGHLVALFYIDFGIEARSCKEDFQIYTSDETCITVGKKPRCPNLLERFTNGLQPKRCHIDILPTVYPTDRVITPPLGQVKSDPGQNPDLLECIPLSGFASCPKLRPLEETSKVLCDSSESNSKRCDTSYTGVGTRCRLFQTCDRAVLIGGGWNRLHSGVQSYQNILTMENALKSTGFLVENIKTFFANGKSSSKGSETKSNNGRRSHRSGDYFSSAMKTGLRGHIRTICETRHCADTLFIYLNNPTTFEGDMLLWDVDYNGIADELEVYTVKEFLSDLSGCEAKRVLIVSDQSNTDILMASLKTSSDHQNVILFAAGLPNQIPINGEYTRAWANNSHPINCLKRVEEAANTQMNASDPVVYDPTHGVTSKLSIIGAPCDLNPPVNSRELKSLYQGCQNVPTSIWFSFNFEEIGDIGEEGFADNNDDGAAENSETSDENSPTSRRIQNPPTGT